MRTRIALPAVSLCLCAVTALPAQAATDAHTEGRLPSGATYLMDVPADWNGTVLLYSHGYRASGWPNPAENAPSSETRAELLADGYALIGSSYATTGWAVTDAVPDQLATLDLFTSRFGTARRTLAWGTSYGGLVTTTLAERHADRFDGSLSMCGLVQGGIANWNSTLDPVFALRTLLAPGADLPLTGFADQAAAQKAAQALTTEVAAAQQTPEGRARIALAAAYLNLPAWAPGKERPAPGDWAGRQAQQYDWFARGILSFVEGGRYHIEKALGGNNSWNKGVDYARVLSASQHAPLVKAMYKEAGLDLRADLTNLTRNATITASPSAVATAERTSSAGQGLAVPLLDIHTTADDLVPAEQETRFAARVRASGDAAQLRQAYVERAGHCNFTTAETVAGLHALEHRLDTGHWGAAATAGALQTAAVQLGLDGAAYVPYRPAPLTIGRRL